MKRFTHFLLLAVTISLSWVSAAQAEQISKDTYVNSIITILRVHADAIEDLNSSHMKYSSNLVRHTIALDRAFGLLGPMDWHAAKSLHFAGTTEENEEEERRRFELLERRSSAAMKGLKLAAHFAMEEDSRELLDKALADMKQSCNNCHALLPASVVPDVWGNLKRK